MSQQLDKAVAAVRAKIGGKKPSTGVVLGSGLGGFAESRAGVTISYADIPGFPKVTVVGHAGQLVVGDHAAILSGRAHSYEGHPLADVVLPVRTLVELGCKTIILTNAAGGIARGTQAGDLVLLRDHINMLGRHPLTGPHNARFGPRFPDMTEVYDTELRELVKSTARALGFELAEGVYAAMMGPSYETPAEIELLRRLGVDLVGMSTVPEAIAAHAMGARIIGISCVTNLAAGSTGKKLSHDEVTETANKTKARFVSLLAGVLDRLRERTAEGKS